MIGPDCKVVWETIINEDNQLVQVGIPTCSVCGERDIDKKLFTHDCNICGIKSVKTQLKEYEQSTRK